MPERDPSTVDHSDLSAVFLNCTLSRSPAPSHTQLLVDRSAGIMRTAGVAVTSIRVVDLDVPPGVQPDMTEHGFDRDDWPDVQRQVMAADVLVVATPIWLGDKSSVATRVVERLYGYSGILNERGQYAYYGRVGGVLVTGNEDGVKHCAMNLLYSLQHLGYTVPPQADAGWIGEVGPGASYGDVPEGGGTPTGFDNDFTNRNLTFMTWNLLHLARLLKDNNGIPAHGNQRPRWAAGERFGFANPEYR